MVLLCFCGLPNTLMGNEPAGELLYKDASVPVEKRVDDLISRMTVDEKIGQLSQYTLGLNNNINNIGEIIDDIPVGIGSLIYFESDPALRNRMQRRVMQGSRLGIPVIFGYDVIHGFRTVYPIPLGQACSWNPKLVEQACAVAAQEARMSGVDWTFSPMVDVTRDPRWGRVAEGYGEDAYTNGVFAAASVRGYQGDNLSDGNQVAACLKHFVGYGASEAGRDYVYTEISKQTLWDTYLKPFQMGVQAGAATIMSAFNTISGVPASANHYTMTDVLRQKWNFDGLVLSDWGAIGQLKNQGLASTLKEAACYALCAGLDMDMMSHAYDSSLKPLIEDGTITMKQIDEAVRRILRIKFRLGLFEQPYTPVASEEDRFLKSHSREVASRLAAQSMVLLKNDNYILPLSRMQKKIAVIGPMGKNAKDLMGAWCGHGKETDVEQLYDGLVTELSMRAELRYAQGCGMDGDERQGFVEAVELARWADVVILCLGERATWSGENASRASMSLPVIQEELAEELKKCGKPIVLILSNGRPLILNRLEQVADAILEIWQPGLMGASAMAGILSGRINPSGKLAITFPYSIGQIPVYYNQRKSGRSLQGMYQDMTSLPMYPFGYGLSYSHFKYSSLVASRSKIKRNEEVIVQVDVTNAGSVGGMETVHWFISDPYCSITRPIKELKYFDKQYIETGGTRKFCFHIIPKRDLGFVDGKGQLVLELGEYEVLVKDQRVVIELVE